MRTAEETLKHIKNTVEQQLSTIEPIGVREWVKDRITEPYPIRLPTDADGKHMDDFWMVTKHKGGANYRIAYSAEHDSFGIVTPLASGIDWYMGDYGSFKNTVESIWKTNLTRTLRLPKWHSLIRQKFNPKWLTFNVGNT